VKPLFLTSFISTALLCLPAFAQTQSYLLKRQEFLPGQTVVTRTSSDASNGQITIISGSSIQKGTSSIKRQRVIVRRIIGSGPTAKLEYTILIDQTHRAMSLGETKSEKTIRGSLTGQILYGLRDDMSRWRLFLKGKTATNQQAIDLVELEAYENRQWFQANPVKVGDTWFIEPAFIRNFIERDMGKALVEATMTFKAVEIIDGEQTAVLTFKIKSQARKEEDNSFRTSSAIANLNGTLYVSLNTMLDKKLIMSGSLTTTVRQNGVSSIIKSPVTYTVTKSLR
jgi:hypothetical protein